MSDGWLETTGTEFGEVDNPDYPGNSKAPWDTTQWNRGAWGDDISGWHTQGVALPNVPRGTRVEVRNPTTGETTVTEVKDKGPGESTGAGIDLLPGTGSAIGLPTNYKGPLEYKILGGGAFDQYQDTPDKTKLSELPEHLDLSDWDQPHRAIEPEPAPQETVEAPPVTKSLIQEFHDQNPTITTSDQGILAEMRQAWAPTMPEEEFKVAATTPGGSDRIRDWNERQKNPLEQVRDEHPEWSNYSDDKLIKTLYSEWTKNGQLDAGKMSLSQFRDRMQPATGFINQTARFIEQANDVIPKKFAAWFPWTISNAEQQSIDNAEPAIKGILEQGYPGQDVADIYKQYVGLTPEQRRKKFMDDWGKTQHEPGLDPLSMANGLEDIFTNVDKKAHIEKSIAWMKKAVGHIDTPGPYQLPPGQEKLLDTIAGLGPQVFASLFPGFRETTLFVNLYGQNKAAIEQNNPGMGKTEVAQKAENATWWQFPGNELLQLSFIRGGPAVAGTIFNRLKNIGIQLGTEATAGAGVGGANQVITNIAAGRDPMFGVGESAGTMAAFGLAGRGLGLTVEGLTRAQTHVPEIRRATGISADIVGATPEEANKIVRGDPNAEVNLKATRNSIDLILSAHVQREAEKGNVPAWQVRREAEIAGKGEEGRPKVPAAPEVAERTVTPGAETTGTLYGAYQRLVQKTGLSSVKLSDLAKELGLSASELKRVLKEVHPENIELSGPNIPEAEYPAEEKTFWIERKGTEPADKVRLYPETAETAQPAPEKTPSEEAFDKARKARNNGDLKTAQKHADQGASLLTGKDKKQHQEDVADAVKGLTKNNVRAKLKNVEGYMGLNNAPRKRLRKRGEMGAAFNPFGGRRQPIKFSPKVEKQYQKMLDTMGLEDTQERRDTYAESTKEAREDLKRQQAYYKATPGGTGPEKRGDPIKSALDAAGLEDTPENRQRMQQFAGEWLSERVTAAATRYNGKVYTGINHAESFSKIPGISDETNYVEAANSGKTEEGFVTNKGRFVDRGEALEIQRGRKSSSSLASEDLGTEEAEAFSGISLSFIRKAAQQLGSSEAVQWVVDPIARTFAPEHRGQGAEETVAVLKPITSRVKNGIQQGIKIIAEAHDMDSFLRDAYRSDRRDAWWGNFSDQQIVAGQSARERRESTGNEIMDKMFDFTRDVYDWLEELGRANGIKFGHFSDYFHHAFKNTEGEVQQVFKDWEPKFGEQAFQKARHYPTLQDALDADLIPESYSPERNLMTYAAAMTTAIRQAQTLKEMSEFNLALPIDDVKAQGLTKQKGWSLHTAPDGQSYYVRDDAAGVLANAFDLHSIYDTIAGPFVAFSRAMKAVTGLKLSWSVFHPLHIASNMWSEVLSTSMQRGLQGTGTAQDVSNAIYATVTGGIGPMVSAYRKYAWLIDALQTGKGLENLSDHQKRDYADVLDMALNPYMGDDRRAALADMLFRGWNGAQKARDWAEAGYKFITAEPWNEFMFGKVIPCVKIASALARRDTILMKKGEAYRSPENMAWKLDLSKINNEVEARFGEMSYDNLFWNRMAKQIGTAVPLSLGWNLGFWKMYGGGVVDVLDNAAHIDQIAKYVATGGKEGRPLNVSNRLLYMVNYTLGTMATSGLITYLMSGTMPNGMDFFFPRIGKKANGDDERVRTPFWTGEWASMYEHFKEHRDQNLDPVIAGAYAAADYFGNKANPGLASIWHLMNNKSFMGRDISDMRDPFWTKQLPDKISFVLKDMLLPISMQDLEIAGGGIRATDPKGLPLEPKQVIMSFMGFTGAPTYTTRTGLQNKIITMFHQQMNMHMGKRESDIFDAKTRYQYAIQSGDQRMQAEELANLHQLGAGSRLIEDARKNAKVPPAHQAYKGLTWENQEYLLKQMNPSEYHEYWPLSHHQAKMEYVRSQ